MSGFYAAVAVDGPLPPAGAYELIERRLGHFGSEPLQRWRSESAAVGWARNDARAGLDVTPAGRLTPVVAGSSHLVERSSLRKALGDVGLLPGTHDNDLVAASWRALGDAWCEHLRGDFAFVLCDDEHHTLRAAVDPMGAESLYWSFDGRLLHVSNTLIGLLDAPGVTDRLNDQVVGYFLLLGTTFSYTRSETVFADIHRLEPGHELVAEHGRVSVRCYWQPPTDLTMTRHAKKDDYPAELRELLHEVVADRLDGVPNALVQLSGGVDSSALLSVAHSLVGSGRINTALQAHTMGYDTLADDPEYPIASELAASLDVPLARFPLDDYRPQRPLPGFGEPSGEIRSGLPLAFAASMKRSGANLSLTGHGADELFGFYPLHKVLHGHSLPKAAALYIWLWRMAGKRPSLGGYPNHLRQRMRGSAAPNRALLGYPAWLDPTFEARLQLRDRWDEVWESWAQPPEPAHPTQPAILRAVRWPQWQNHAEGLTAPSSAPMRDTSPFLDLRILEFAQRLPPGLWARRKAILREAMSGLLPDSLLRRPKTAAPDFQVQLVNAADAAWIDGGWEPSDQLAQYVAPDRIPPVRGATALANVRSGLRPLLLNDWMEAIRSR